MDIFIKLSLWNVLEICNYFTFKLKQKQLLSSCYPNKPVTALNRSPSLEETLKTHLGCPIIRAELWEPHM